MRSPTASRAVSAHSESLSVYLAEIGRHPLLSAADERRLGHLIERGREAQRELEGDGDLTEQRCRELAQNVAEAAEATRTFVTSNLRLVVSMARHYEASGLPLLDLIQEGNIGLMRAVAGFDHRRGFRFSTYASWAIRQAIVRGISNTGRLIRLPVHTGALIARIRRAQTGIEAEGVDHLMTDELARRVGTTPRRVREALAWERGPVSLSKPIGGAEDELGDLIADTSVLSPLDQAVLSGDLEAMAKALAMLEEPEYRVLCLRFGLDDDDPTSIAEVGRRLEMSSEAARSIQVRAISKLRCSMRELECAP